MSGEEKAKGDSVTERAFGSLADEFSNSSKGAGKILGEGALTVAKTARVLLSPFRALVWGYEQIGQFIEDDVERKLERVPPDKI